MLFKYIRIFWFTRFRSWFWIPWRLKTWPSVYLRTVKEINYTKIWYSICYNTVLGNTAARWPYDSVTCPDLNVESQWGSHQKNSWRSVTCLSHRCAVLPGRTHISCDISIKIRNKNYTWFLYTSNMPDSSGQKVSLLKTNRIYLNLKLNLKLKIWSLVISCRKIEILKISNWILCGKQTHLHKHNLERFNSILMHWYKLHFRPKFTYHRTIGGLHIRVQHLIKDSPALECNIATFLHGKVLHSNVSHPYNRYRRCNFGCICIILVKVGGFLLNSWSILYK